MGFSVVDIPDQAWGEGGFFVLLFIIVCAIISGLGGLLFILGSALRWLGREILGPVKARIFDYIDTVEDEIKSISAEIKSSCKFDPNKHSCKHNSNDPPSRDR